MNQLILSEALQAKGISVGNQGGAYQPALPFIPAPMTLQLHHSIGRSTAQASRVSSMTHS